MTSVWPPPPSDLDAWDWKPLLQRGEPRRAWLRRVRLWGRLVWIEEPDDDEVRVWCPNCKQLIAVGELGEAGSRHRSVSVPASRASATLIPMSLGDELEARDGRRREVDVRTVGF